MFDDSWSNYLDKFLSSVRPVSGLISDFFKNLFLNIPEFEQLFAIASGVMFLFVGIFLFYRLLSE